MTQDWMNDLDKDDIKTVQSIINPHYDAFCTKAYGPDSDLYNNEATGPVTQFYYAWRKPDSDLWRVEKITSFNAAPDENGQSAELYRKTDRISGAASLFSALSYCADFEYDQDLQGTLPVTSADDTYHYFRTVAEDTGFPSDLDGRLLPAAHGHILTEARYDTRAVEIAKKTKDSQHAKNIDDFLSAALLKDLRRESHSSASGALVRAKTKNTLPDSPEFTARLKLLDEFESAASTAEHVSHLFEKHAQTNKNFNDLVDSVSFRTVRMIAYGLMIGSGGLLLGSALYSAHLGKNSYRYLDKKLKALDNLADKQPEQKQLATMLSDFTRSARAAYSLEEASRLHRYYGWTRKAKYLDKGGQKVMTAANLLDMRGEERGALLKSFMDGTLGAPGDNSAHLKDKAQTIRQTVEQLKRDI